MKPGTPWIGKNRQSNALLHIYSTRKRTEL